MAPELSVIGKPLPRVDGAAKVTGRARYADDLSLPRMLYGKILRSTQPHARIKAIDTSRAQALPGVHAIITGQDLPIKYGMLPVSQEETALAVDKVRYVGEPVAAVAAVDEETAEEALQLIRVEYEPLPPIMSIEEALRPEAPPIHERGNIHRTLSFEFGDVEEGFRQADYVREDLFFYGGSTHLPLEEHSTLALYDPSEGKLTLWSSTQVPHYLHRLVAKVLELPPHRVRVIATPVGGGFGGKGEPLAHEMIAAKLAMVTGRPVKITLTREEVFYTHRGRHPTLVWIKTGFKKDGTMTAVHIRSCLDGGAHSGFGVVTTHYGSGTIHTICYKIPRFKMEGARVYTNKAPCGPKRGHGMIQTQLAREVQLDKVAQELGLDPVEMRLRQLMPPNSLTVNWLRITSNGLRECIEKVVEASGWRQKFGKLPYGQGIGFACTSFVSGAGHAIWRDEADMPHSTVRVSVDRWGTVTVQAGTPDIGQGSDTMLATVVAEVLGLRPQDIRLLTADTDLTPVDLGAYSSRVTLMTGRAAFEAAQEIARTLRRVAAERLGVAEEKLALGEGRIYDPDNPELSLPFMEAARLAEVIHGPLSATGGYNPGRLGGAFKGAGVGPSPAYSFSACIAQVRVNTKTGEVQVEKIWMAHDCGRALNPLLVEGQLEGSIYMGLGEALLEEQAYRKGLHKGPSMLDYKSLTVLEMPQVEGFIVESVDPEGPFGAKEASEGCIGPIMPAVLNAIHDAVGIRIDEVPVTPEKVLKALEEKAKGGEGRYGPKGFPPITFPEPRRIDPPPQWQTGEYREG